MSTADDVFAILFQAPQTTHKISKRWNRGCHLCPLDGKGRKVKGLKRIKGKRAMLWAQSPGKWELIKGLELVGPAGAFTWRELGAVGFKRDDFDIQNVLRCRPINKEKRDREPTAEERYHCSLFNHEAVGLNGGKAKLHLLFGAVAQEEILGSERRKDVPVKWSTRLNAWTVSLDHPSFFLRREEQGEDWRLQRFRDRIRGAKFFYDHPGRWAIYKAYDFKTCQTIEEVRTMFRTMAKVAAKGERIAVDIEEGPVGEEPRVLTIAFSWSRNSARCVVVHHPESPYPEHVGEILALIKGFLNDRNYSKVFQYGSSDIRALRKLLKIRVKGYDYDTTYAHYLKYTFLRSHGLEAIADEEYPEYAGYKQVVQEWLKDPKKGFTQIPLRVLGPYNCADAALTKIIELDTRDTVPQPLIWTYIWAGMTLSKMEGQGPLLDRGYFKQVMEIIPKRIKAVELELRRIADDPNFNANTPAAVADVLYNKLRLQKEIEDPEALATIEEAGTSTAEEVLETIRMATNHPFPGLVLDYRRLTKMKSTYLDNYQSSADFWGGEVRTKWFLTGAVTGRLRSGGVKKEKGKYVNMQNLHGDPLLQNLLVSDTRWPMVLEMSKNTGKVTDGKTVWDNRSLVPKGVKKFWDVWEFNGKISQLPDDLEILLSFDYSQIEIRMLAEVSGDELLIQQFNAGMDIHCVVGNTLNPAWSLEFIKSDKDTRTFIKNCHFGMVYGLDEEGLYFYLKAKGVNTTKQKVAKFHRAYFRKYVGVAQFIEAARAFATEFKYVETIFNFRRRVGGGYDEERTTNPENQAINSPIQGAAHHLVLTALGLLSRKPKEFDLLQKGIMEVHDALVYRVQLKQLAQAYTQGLYLMQEAVPQQVREWYNRDLQVPLLAEASAGFRYGVKPDYAGGNVREFLSQWVTYNQHVEADARKKHAS